MISEEEKKAIDYYKNNEAEFSFSVDMDKELFLKALGVEAECDFETEMIRVRTLINLILKQQAEIERYEKICKEYGIDDLANELIEKDKIIAQLQELRKEPMLDDLSRQYKAYKEVE